MALPPESQNGRIRFTEQGEVSSYRYALPGLARRHLEQIVNAELQSIAYHTSAAGKAHERTPKAWQDLMETIAQRSMQVYRELIDDDEAWLWYTQVTPIEHISRLPIASRPVARGRSSEVGFDDLRAIPWVFAWTQVRYNVPGWYGTGTALAGLMADEGGASDAIARMYVEWPFFRALVDNAQREMARARLDIATEYDRLDHDGEAHADLHARIADDFRLARDAILRITEQQTLLDNDPVIQRSIELRNPYTDVLNLVQIELIRRFRSTDDDTQRDAFRQALFLSINGIAAAMQSTG
jgi:phosphoenolpyruvate carboxylase